MKQIRKVFISGPYTFGDPVVNTRTAMEAWEQLRQWGFVPFCPHWSMFQHFFSPVPYDEWIRLDLEWVAVCDAVLRLPGASKGAEMETTEAKRLGIPVYYGLKSLQPDL